MRKGLIVFTLLSVVVIIGFLFITGPALLTYNFAGIPLGNLLVWVGLVAFQMFIYLINSKFKYSNNTIIKAIRLTMHILIMISICWFAIAYLLSGNLNFNFSSGSTGFTGSVKASILYWNVIYVLLVMPLVLMIFYQSIRLFKKTRG